MQEQKTTKQPTMSEPKKKFSLVKSMSAGAMNKVQLSYAAQFDERDPANDKKFKLSKCRRYCARREDCGHKYMTDHNESTGPIHK